MKDRLAKLRKQHKKAASGEEVEIDHISGFRKWSHGRGPQPILFDIETELFKVERMNINQLEKLVQELKNCLEGIYKCSRRIIN